MQYEIKVKGSFKRAYKRCLKRGLEAALLTEVLTILSTTGSLPAQYRPHKLVGKYATCGNVIFSPIGCWCGNNTMKSWC